MRDLGFSKNSPRPDPRGLGQGRRYWRSAASREP